MIKEGNFGSFEAVSLTTILLITNVFYTFPAILVPKTGTSAWYTTLISCFFTLISFYIFYIILKRLPGKNIIQIFDILLGRILGKVLGLSYSAFALYYCGSNLREFTEMIKAYILPYTPISIILGGMLIAAMILAYLGLETLARLSAASLIPILLGLAFIFMLSIPNYDTSLLKPYLGYGLGTTLNYGLLNSSAYCEFFILPIFILSVHNLKTFKRVGILSILISGIVICISIMCYLLAFGYKQGSENMAGLFELSKLIYINRFLERMESVFLFSWVIASVITVAVSFYFSISIYSTSFKIKNYHPLLFPFTFLTFVVAILPKNISEVVDINLHFLRQNSVFFIHSLPFVLLLLAIIRKKKGVLANVQKS